MKIKLEDIMRIVNLVNINFDEEITDLIINNKTGLLEERNTIEHSILYGTTKDMQIQGIRLKKGIGYSLRKLKMNIIPEKSSENYYVGLKIQIIYEMRSKLCIRRKKCYITSETHVRFPVISIYNGEYRGKWLPLFPYIVDKRIYSFDNLTELEGYYSTEEDVVWKNNMNKFKRLFEDADFFITSMELEIDEEDFLKIIDYSRTQTIKYKSILKGDYGAVYRIDYEVV